MQDRDLVAFVFVWKYCRLYDDTTRAMRYAMQDSSFDTPTNKVYEWAYKTCDKVIYL